MELTFLRYMNFPTRPSISATARLIRLLFVVALFLLATSHASDKLGFYHCDHLGTPQEITDEEGNIAWSAQYKAWGKAKETLNKAAQQAGFKNPIRFQGQYFDHETGLHYNRFRYYDPEIGRFISKDPIKYRGGMNLHRYAPNPVEWVDPFGLTTVYRGMSVDSDGKPVVYSGPTKDGMNAANSLGIRQNNDGSWETNMSTSTTIEGIQDHRRPEEFGGKQKNAAMFSIESEELADFGLKCNLDGKTHVSVTTANNANSGELPSRLAKTKNKWKRVKK